jgi:hypothetical protein
MVETESVSGSPVIHGGDRGRAFSNNDFANVMLGVRGVVRRIEADVETAQRLNGYLPVRSVGKARRVFADFYRVTE